MISLPGTVLSLVMILAAVALVAPFAHADLKVDGSAYDKSVIIELVSDSEVVSYFKVWAADGTSLDSFKAESGWAGEKMSDGSILFTTSDRNPNEKTKFGLVADVPLKKLSWEAGDGNDSAGTGVLVLVDEPKLKPEPEPEPAPEPVFRIVPERPNIGSTIRVVGESLQPSADFDFYINDGMIGTFTASGAGYFAGTAKIPANIDPGRAEFRLGSGDDALTLSIRLDHPGGLSPLSAVFSLDKTPDAVYRGDSITLRGTGDPDARIIIEIKEPDGSLANSLISQADEDGRWSADPVVFAFDAPFGTYTATVTDGHSSKTGTWNVESSRVMDIRALETVLKPGEVIRFEGTGLPNEQIQLAVENPDGNKVGTEFFTTNDTGRVEYEYQTSADSKLGPYTLIATQGGQTEFVHTSLGKKPKFDFNLELDKNSYARGETVVISISGDKSDTLGLAILSERGNTRNVEYEADVVLDPEGRGLHRVVLGSNYTEGTYTAKLSKGNIGDEEKFGVDLRRTSPTLVLAPVKDVYARGETMLIVGTTAPGTPSKSDISFECDSNSKNVQIIIRLVDPDGKITRSKPTFIDNNCSVIDRSFKVPDDAALGTWHIVSNIQLVSSYNRTGSFTPPSSTVINNTAAGPSYDGCVPATDLGNLVLLACRKDVDGANPTPVLRLVGKTGLVAWERETELVDDIFRILNETRGVIQGLEPAAPAKKAVKFDHDCADPIRTQPRNSTSTSNQTKIDLLGIKHVSCSYGLRYNAPEPVCTGAPGIDPVPENNATALNRLKLGDQTILFTCRVGTNNTDSATRTITMIDREKPRIFLDGRTVANHFKNEPYVEPGWRCTDNADENPVRINTVELLNIGALGKHKITYICTDASGNKAVKTRDITIVDPCDLDSYARPDGKISHNIIGCGGSGRAIVESPFEVVDIHDKTLRVRAEDGDKVGTGKLVNVIVTGSKKGTEISITYENGRLVQEYTVYDDDNKITYHWLTDRLIEPGTYKIAASYQNQKAETEYYVPLR